MCEYGIGNLPPVQKQQLRVLARRLCELTVLWTRNDEIAAHLLYNDMLSQVFGNIGEVLVCFCDIEHINYLVIIELQTRVT